MVDKHLLADFATQYYVAGRQAAMAALIPVHGNLLHHAVEMYLKAALLGTLKLDQMKKKPYSHDLIALWDRFKEKESGHGMAGFAGTIRALHSFERIRYPELIAEKGMVGTVAWGPIPTMASEGATTYEVVISEVDALVLEVLRRASINPKPLLLGNRVRREAILYQNLLKADWTD